MPALLFLLENLPINHQCIESILTPLSNHNIDQTALTAQKCKTIKEKMEKVFTNLKIENLQGKTAQEQRANIYLASF